MLRHASFTLATSSIILSGQYKRRVKKLNIIGGIINI